MYAIAAQELIDAMNRIGLDIDVAISCDPRYPEFSDGVQVVGTIAGTDGFSISVCEYWAHPGIPCYFVNWTHGKSFVCNMGTPFIEKALFDIGGVVHFAHSCKKS
jgi:hypothetical protein